MFGQRMLAKVGRVVAGSALVMLLSVPARAQDVDLAEIKARLDRLEKQNEDLVKQNEELRQRVEAARQSADADGDGVVAKDEEAKAEKDIQRIVADYLNAHPGAGMPKGVQTGYTYGNGFTIRSAPNPSYTNWNDGLRVPPFEMRIRGRMQMVYYNFQQTSNLDHISNAERPLLSGDVKDDQDFSALEVKRMRLIFEGHAFDPDLKYRIQLNADTRGLGGFFNNEQIVNGSPVGGGGGAIDGGGVLTDHTMRLFEAWVAYDWKPGRCKDDCCDSPNCLDGLTYTPTLTFIVGKVKLLGPLEEYLGSANEQFVEFSMASWFFSPDDDNLAMAAGMYYRALQDRFYAVTLVTNGSESNFAAAQLDDYPGANAGFWYDFGGTWDESRKVWQLFGDSMSDIDYSRNPVVRAGGAWTYAPFDRRRLYGDIEQSRYFTVDGGRRLIDVLNGGGGGNFINAVDRFDTNILNTFVAGKYRGFSLANEWWFRYMNNFETVPAGANILLYNSSTAQSLVFPRDSLFDYGMQLQGGYFLIPNKVELVGRWTYVSGESGNINGGFDAFETANEYTVGINYFIRRHLLKWQTDVGVYEGGAPIAPSAAGFPANRDGWLLRTQLQLAF